jgi:Mg-chelatase subunit ChlD
MFFTHSTINFEAKPIYDNNVLIPLEKAHFGILDLQTCSSSVTHVEQEFIFVVDQSGSMSDLCSDGRTKMQHITYTMKNMVIYFNDTNFQNIHISIFAFDDTFHKIIDRTRITKENVQEILLSIDTIRPVGGTDIENALKKVGELIDDIRNTFPRHIVNHIFMTDGEATAGNVNKTYLRTLVKDTIYNAFIGFGAYHDSQLLNILSQDSKSAYYFIDALEKSGLVYGEILHYILYKLMTDVVIDIKNGLIYNFKKNEWVQHLAIEDITGESNKIYHIISNNVDECDAFVEGIFEGKTIRLSVSRLYDEKANFAKYIYRQRTLELLFEANLLQNTNAETENSIWNSFCALSSQNTNADLDNTLCNSFQSLSLKKQYASHDEEDKEQILKQKLRSFIEELKTYMEVNNADNDKFLKNLCDDIYISYRTIGTKYGSMYTGARQTSQGTQRCYTVTETPDDNFNFGRFTPKLQRHSKDIYNEPILFLERPFILDDIEPEPLMHSVSDFIDSPYLIPTATKMMRDISHRLCK